ncbi:MAG: hypothetical protein Q4E62_06140 [Sutterellaceae bacterium]|nr:hypothetical protein [Sutterellaceae bacterium]
MLTRRFLLGSSLSAAAAILCTNSTQAKALSKPAAGAVFYVANDCRLGREKAFHLWYQTQHLDETLGIPGTLSGRRYARVSPASAPNYLTVYDLQSADVFSSTAFRRRLADKTPMTDENLRLSMVQMQAGVLDVVWSDGHGTGIFLDIFRLRDGSDVVNKLKSSVDSLWLTSDAIAFEQARCLKRKNEAGLNEYLLAVQWADIAEWPIPDLGQRLKGIGLMSPAETGSRFRLLTAR